MKLNPPKIPKKYQPLGFHILHEDPDIIVGNKSPGFLTVAALWNKDKTIESALDNYVKKGSSVSRNRIFVVHRLDQATSGLLVFAKSEKVQQYLKNNWPTTVKYYYAIVHGLLKDKTKIIESYLEEDEDYVVKSTTNIEKGKFAKTEYTVLHEENNLSLVKINLLTGKKNQIRVHFAELGHPLVGDLKYGSAQSKYKDLMLHSYFLEITHPFKKERVHFEAPVPDYFKRLISYKF